MKKLSYALFCSLCILVLFQDFIGIILFNLGVPKYLLQIFLSLKDVIILSMVALGLITCSVLRQWIPLNATVFFFAGYSLIVAVYYIVFGGLGNVQNNLNDLRSLIFPVYAFIAGYVTITTDKDRMVKFIEKAAVFSVLLSLLLYLMGDNFLIKLRVLDYTEDVRGYFGMIYKGLPSAYFTRVGDMTIFRLAGPVFNSVGTATLYTFVAGLSVAYYKFVEKSQKRRFLLAMLILSIILTFSRGAVLGFILGLVMVDLLWPIRTPHRKPIMAVYLILVILIIAFYRNFANVLKDTFLLTDPSAKGHYNGLIASWEYLRNNWIGGGVGSLGMWRFTDYSGGAGENSFVHIIGQVGIFAFLFLACAYLSVIKKLIKHRDDYLSYGLLICAVAALFNSIFSPTLLVVTPMILFWFFIGYSQAHASHERKT